MSQNKQDNVTQLFPKKEKENKYSTGEAFCISCKHEWTATVELPVIQLKCPSCHTMKGLLKYPFHVDEGEPYLICECENDLFRLTPNGYICPNCGDYQNYE